MLAGIELLVVGCSTGYSNLACLQRFVVDKLQVDQSFVRRLVASQQDRAIVRAIIQMVSALNLDTAAEGIEVEATRTELAAMGCLRGQGYLFARPQLPPGFRCLAEKVGVTAPAPAGPADTGSGSGPVPCWQPAVCARSAQRR